jgi:hypothetical protein
MGESKRRSRIGRANKDGESEINGSMAEVCADAAAYLLRDRSTHAHVRPGGLAAERRDLGAPVVLHRRWVWASWPHMRNLVGSAQRRYRSRHRGVPQDVMAALVKHRPESPFGWVHNPAHRWSRHKITGLYKTL